MMIAAKNKRWSPLSVTKTLEFSHSIIKVINIKRSMRAVPNNPSVLLDLRMGRIPVEANRTLEEEETQDQRRHTWKTRTIKVNHRPLQEIQNNHSEMELKKVKMVRVSSSQHPNPNLRDKGEW
jgi:hypothetical protein